MHGDLTITLCFKSLAAFILATCELVNERKFFINGERNKTLLTLPVHQSAGE